ncbi:cytochrome P450 [Desertimonas flava]|uniref:cytochrome P450 n=1 Tax=Desertimonas flava TaxID=2064846 RepID=UPI000E34D939|nr:cytochrome P450 [Desertimonas flava]
MSGPSPAVDAELDLGPSDADIADPDTYVAGVPHATFARLRRDDPVSWWAEDHAGGSGFWAVTRHHDLLRVSRDVATFSSAKGIRLEEMSDDETAARRTMMELDPPEHTAYRRLVSKPFSRREVMAYEQAIRVLARAVLDDALAGRGASAELDFVDDIARQLPMRMLGTMLGVDDADGPWLVEKGDALLGNTDPEYTSHPVGLVDTDEFRLLPFRSPAGIELFRYAQEQAARRREHPTDDVISDLLRPKVDGETLSEHEFNNFFTLLVAAGNDTTRYTMAAGMKALIERPAVLDELRAAVVAGRGEVVASAVEEVLRWGSVTMHFRRTAMSDTTIGERQVRAGDKVLIWFVSANYDAEVFGDPYVFDIHRTPNPQVAFGMQSPHLCLGAQLARMEIKVLFEELLPRLAGAEIVGPAPRLRSNFIAGIKHLPVRFALA